MYLYKCIRPFNFTTPVGNAALMFSSLYICFLDYALECTSDTILKMTLKVNFRALRHSPPNVSRSSVLTCDFLFTILTAYGVV